MHLEPTMRSTSWSATDQESLVTNHQNGNAATDQDHEVNGPERIEQDAVTPPPPSIGTWATDFRPTMFDYSSVVDTRNDRLKIGVATPAHSTEEMGSWLWNCRLNGILHRVSRVSVKLLVPHGVTPPPHAMNGKELLLEGYVPVQGHPEIAGIAYYGACTIKRAPSPDFVQQCMELWAEARADCIPKPVEVSHVERFNEHTTLTDAEQVARVYDASFTEYLVDLQDANMVLRMLEGGIAVGIRDPVTHRWVAVAIAEHVEIPVPGSAPVSFWEISDVATHPDFRGRNYGLALYRYLVDEIRRDHPHAVITTEIRANWKPMHRIMAKTGFALASDYESQGVLRNQCVIRSTSESLRQDGIYGTLGLFYVP